MTHEEALGAARAEHRAALEAAQAAEGEAMRAFAQAKAAEEEARRVRSEAAVALDEAIRKRRMLTNAPLNGPDPCVRFRHADGSLGWHPVTQNGPKRAGVGFYVINTGARGVSNARRVHPDDRCVLRVFGPGGALADLSAQETP